jgi:hypothetical protein
LLHIDKCSFSYWQQITGDINASAYTLTESDGRRIIAAILPRLLQKSYLSSWQRDSGRPFGGPSTGRSSDESIDMTGSELICRPIPSGDALFVEISTRQN